MADDEPEPDAASEPPQAPSVEVPERGSADLEAQVVPSDAPEAPEERLGPHWRLRRFLVTTAVFLMVWFAGIALLHTGTPAVVYLVLLLPFYLLALPFALRTPKRFRQARRHTLMERLTWQSRLMIGILVLLAVYLPFTFFSNTIIPYAPIVEFFLFAFALFVLYHIAGRSVGVAPSHEALPPPSHRIHQQVVVPIDDPHYQRTLFLNHDFLEKGRGAKTLAKRLEDALESVGVEDARRRSIVDDLERYREGFHFAFTRRSRERRRSGREQRAQILRRVYTRFNQELEFGA